MLLRTWSIENRAEQGDVRWSQVMVRQGIVYIAAAVLCAVLAGCAGEAGEGPETGSTSLAGGSCAGLKAEAARLEARGVQYKADQAGRGEIKLSPQQKADVDRYNSVLNQYLGGKCHM